VEGEISLTKREMEFTEIRESTGIQGWGGGGWEEQELQQRGRELAAQAEVRRLLRRAGRRCTTQAWEKSAFLEDCKEMAWSLLLLIATLTFTKPPSLFAFLFPACQHWLFSPPALQSSRASAMGEGL